MAWKNIGACSGGGSVDISNVFSDAREFLAMFAFSAYRVTINIPNAFIDANGNFYYGGASNGADNLYAVAKISKTKITFIAFSKGGNDYSAGNMQVFYR